MRRLRNLLDRLKTDQRGSLIVEFALMLPMALILLMSGAEAGRYILLKQKMDRAATSIGDLVSQEDKITEGEMTSLFDAVKQIITPYSFTTDGIVIVSSVGPGSGGSGTKINWQRKGGGGLTANSKIGAQGGAAALPAGLTVKTGETVIATEVYYSFKPIFVPGEYTGMFTNEILYHRAFFRPRTGSLDTIDP